jgi:hypothetical protein
MPPLGYGSDVGHWLAPALRRAAGGGLDRDAGRNSCSIPGGQWRWASDHFAEAPQVLSDGRECELELGAAWTAQPEPTKSKNALQVCKQHLDFLAVAPRLGELLGSSDGTRNVASCFVHIAWHLALW